jgi:RHS repeat-associated protein
MRGRKNRTKFTFKKRLAHFQTSLIAAVSEPDPVLPTKDTHGHILARYTYQPYGTQQSGPTNNGPGYTRHVNDPATGLMYMQQRYYDPAIGRFISPDPVAPAPGNIFSFGRYTYANDNPVVNTDPTGASCMIEHKAPCDSDGLPPDQSPSPLKSQKSTILPTVTVTATAVAVGAPIDWGGIGLGTITIGSIPASILVTGGVGALLYPTKMDAAPCEMPPFPPCGMMSEMGDKAPTDAPPGTLPLDKAKRKYGLGKDEVHKIKDAATGGMGGGRTWVGVDPSGEVGISEGGKWVPQGNVNELKQ